MTGKIVLAESGAGKSSLAAKYRHLLDTDDLFHVWCAAANRSGWDILRDPDAYAKFREQAVRFYAPRLFNDDIVMTWDAVMALDLRDAANALPDQKPEPYICAYAYRDVKDLLSAKHEQYVSKHPPKQFSDDDTIVEGHRNFLACVIDMGLDLQWIPQGYHLEDVL